MITAALEGHGISIDIDALVNTPYVENVTETSHKNIMGL